MIKKFYKSLSKKSKAIFLLLTIPLSTFIGAISGFMLGLIATTFIPSCETVNGLRNCFEFNGMVGYEATGYLGFWVGVVLVPLVYVGAIFYLEIKKNEL